ncbi:hypothetical protein M438DRAFT_119493 [Aureobasidium pullulans EXF-150]|uniref:Uncharacterized protein n=1 Tax=Aureobasidium pullulans EXF-150 TaxID=1043002 RepID=A0A074XDR8_AURPU|nr:uncharacterized protein M438DRAFT_119493 [Aureobasidium pullulans EXF-150]KEQ80167.1 hypothetical protein M438DRAFT_119493 [Aureobasidium pullulans EXF-150]
MSSKPENPYKFRCRACISAYTVSEALVKHRRICDSNRDAYLKIQAMELDPTDRKTQDKLWIHYDYVPNERRLTSIEHENIGIMKRQLDIWGDKPPTREFINNLGNRISDDILFAEDRKRKRIDDGEVSLPNPHVRASASASGIYQDPSPLPREGSRPVSAVFGGMGVRRYSMYPGNSILRSLAGRQQGGYPYTLPPAEASIGDFTSDFDQAFAIWLDDENISKAAIRRLLNDPAMGPITSLLSWNSVGQMKEKLEGFETDEDVDEDGDGNGNGDVSNRW